MYAIYRYILNDDGALLCWLIVPAAAATCPGEVGSEVEGREG